MNKIYYSKLKQVFAWTQRERERERERECVCLCTWVCLGIGTELSPVEEDMAAVVTKLMFLLQWSKLWDQRGARIRNEEHRDDISYYVGTISYGEYEIRRL